jgi:hypothetical protein
MANTAPGSYNGFQQYSGTGSAPTYEQIAGAAAYNASAIYFGDPIILNGSTGLIQRATTTAGTTSVAPLAGVFVGCKYLSVSQKRTVWSNFWVGSDVASGNYVEVYYVNDPNAKFEVWSDATGIALTDVGSTGGFNIGTGNASNGISGAYLNWGTSGGNADGTGPFRIIGLAGDPPGMNGTEFGAYARVVVAFNNVATKTLNTI